jgi:Tol biopolymer transport system component
MLSSEGRVKVLDFGLAKLMEAAAREMALPGVPTETLTDEGRIMGTAAYMSPEQAEGKSVDNRSDVFSLGILLYEMATGERPFKGESRLSVLSAIVKDTPRSVTDLNPAMPREFARVVNRCLAKETDRRYQTAVDLRNELEELRTDLELGVVRPPATRAVIRTSLKRPVRAASIWTVVALLIGAVLVFVFRRDVLHRDTSPPLPPVRRQITFAGDASSAAISRDGKFLAYITDRKKLMVQELSGGQALQVFEGENLFAPVWSNDGSELLISNYDTPSPGEVRIVPRLGGPTRSVSRGFQRMSWSPDNTRFAGIDPWLKQIFVVDKKKGGVTTIPIAGSFMNLNAVDWSPAGDWLLFQTSDEKTSQQLIWTIRVDGSGQQKVLEEKPIFYPRWSPTGDAIYYLLRGGDSNQLMKFPVSRRTGQATGPAQAVIGDLPLLLSDITISDHGQLTYTQRVSYQNLWLASTKLSSAARELTQLTIGSAADMDPSISPDGRHVAFVRGIGSKSNVFVMPIEGGTPQQITVFDSRNWYPVWSPDGGTIAFFSTEGGQPWVWQVSATGGTPHSLDPTRVSAPFTPFTLAWAPGLRILYPEPDNRNFQVLNPATGEQRRLFDHNFVGRMGNAQVSPDGSKFAVNWSRRGHDRLNSDDGLWVIPFQTLSDARLLAADNASSGMVSQSVDALPLRGREVSLVAHVKTDVSGHGNQGQCWLRVDRPTGKRGFFDDMQGRPVRSSMWTEVTIAGKVDDDAERVAFGCFLAGTGQMWVDDIKLQRRSPGGPWEVVPIKNPGFEESDERMRPAGWDTKNLVYTFQVTDAKPNKGKRSLAIKSTHMIGQRFSPIGWSSDGRYVYAFGISSDQTDVVMIGADGAEIKPLIDVPLPWTRTVAITPDGHRVVYGVPQGLSDVWIVQNFDSKR